MAKHSELVKDHFKRQAVSLDYLYDTAFSYDDLWQIANSEKEERAPYENDINKTFLKTYPTVGPTRILRLNTEN